MNFDLRSRCWLLFFFGLALFSFHYGDFELTRLDCRFGLFAKEMAANGVTAFPTLYGKPYADYPAAMTVLIHLTSLAFGKIGPFTAGLGSAVAASLTLLLTYLIGRERSEDTGFFGCMLVLLCYEFVADARAPSPDIFVALAAAAAFYFLWQGLKKGRRMFLLGLPLCLVFGFAFRGPIGLVIPAAVIFVFHLVERRHVAALAWGFLSFLVLGVCVYVMYKAADAQGGHELAKAVFESQVGGRISKQKPIFYYFVNGLGNCALAYPLALIFLFFYLQRNVRLDSRDERLFIFHLAAWAAVIMIGMSVPGTKHMRYILAVLPALALLAGLVFAKDAAGFRSLATARAFLLKVFAAAPVMLLLLLAASWLVFKIILRGNAAVEAPPIPYFLAFASIFGVYAVIRACARKLEIRRDKVLAVYGAVFLNFLVLFFVEPVDQVLENSRGFVETAERAANGGAVHFFRMGPDGEDVKYALHMERKPNFCFPWGEDGLDSAGGSDIVVVKESDYKKMGSGVTDAFSVVFQGTLGHRKCVVLKRK